MKTLSKNSAAKKLSKLTISKTSITYKLLVDIIQGKKQIRPCYTSGSGRFTTNQDHTLSLCWKLDEMGIEYKISNDSPRGGKTGTLITISTKIK